VAVIGATYSEVAWDRAGLVDEVERRADLHEDLDRRHLALRAHATWTRGAQA
jgi:hypothetical protein